MIPMRMPWRRSRASLEAARSAYMAARSDSTADRVRAAGAWCTAATDADAADETADAYWELIVTDADAAVPSSRRLPGPLSGSGAALGEAGYRLLLAGRSEDAARLLEYGRTVQVRRALGAMTARQRSVLLDLGEEALVDAYDAAVAELAAVLRAYRTEDGVLHPMTEGYDPVPAAEKVVAELEEAIAAVLGAPAGPPAYAEIQAAADDAPLIYLGVAGDGGYAITIGPSGPPVSTALPGLTRHQAHRLHRVAPSEAVDRLVPLLMPVTAVATAASSSVWASTSTSAGRPGPRLVTLVPVGPLGRLPLHAVFVLAGLAVRHTSSAGALPPGGPALLPGSTVIGVEAAHPADRRMGDLPLVGAQDELLTGTYGTRWRRIPDATADQVLAELPTADVCQFLCHSDADPVRTYDKGVVLTDRTLRVSEILAHAPRRQRLVILSDLSRTPGAGRPDEPAGFPDAMLQLGAQGVVAPSWAASQAAAALVLQRFHEEMAAGTEPVNALADAQRWLRSATGREISRDFPGLYHDEPQADPAARPFAAHAEWAAFTYTGI